MILIPCNPIFMSNNPKKELSCKNLNELEDVPLIRQTERLQCLIEVFFVFWN